MYLVNQNINGWEDFLSCEKDKSYFKEFTLAVNLEGYNEVKIVAVNHFKFPKAPVYDRKRKYSWIFIDEVIFW